MKRSRAYLFAAAVCITLSAKAQLAEKSFREGIIYSRTSFPGHPLNDSLKKIDFEAGDYPKQYTLIQEIRKHQQSIEGINEQAVKDAFFASAMMILPAYSKTYYSASHMLISTDALGFHQVTYLANSNQKGKLVIKDRDDENRGTVSFDLPEIKMAWQKYEVESTQYDLQRTNETRSIAGYSCKKIIYTFKGTSRLQPTTNVVNLQPEKVTVWYSDEIDPSINLQHPLYFELNKAILQFEVEFDKDRKNKMMVEITGLLPQHLEQEKFDLKDLAPHAEFKKDAAEAGLIVMKVMMSAVSLLSK